MEGKRLVRNTLFMTCSSIVMRALGLWFQVWLSGRIGPAGVGLATLIGSVNSLAATFAISGIRFTTTRLVSEELGRGGAGNVGAVVRRCLAYAVFFGTLASLTLYSSSELIGTRFLGDGRTVTALRVMSVSMPFISAGAVLGGYFTGTCRVGRAIAGTASEQVCKMAVSWALLSALHTADVEQMCASVAAGGAAGEIFSFFVVLAIYIFDKQRKTGGMAVQHRLTARVLSTAMPLALTAYARVALNTVQNLLIPIGLRASGASSEAALSAYGTVHGMVFPVITFPMVLFASVSELIVPELTEEQVRGNGEVIERSANTLLRMCFAFSAAVAAALICFSGELGRVLYGSAQAGSFIGLLAPLMPIMYMDNVTDGMLRGLNQHIYSMAVNIIDSLVSTALIWLVLPRFAVYGYIAILYASEIFNFTLSMRRLSKVTVIRPRELAMGRTVCASLLTAAVTALLTRLTGGANTRVGLAAGLSIFAALYTGVICILQRPAGRETPRMTR